MTDKTEELVSQLQDMRDCLPTVSMTQVSNLPEELKACPFCGSQAGIGEYEDHLGNLWPSVVCSGEECRAEIVDSTPAAAIARGAK
jgi:hypothetical protein